LLVLVITLLVMCLAPTTSLAAAEDTERSGPGFQEHRQVRDNLELVDINSCSTAVPVATAHCHARARTDAVARAARPARTHQARPTAGVGNNGAYDPSFLQSAYNLASAAAGSGGRDQIVAIVDAYDNPNAASDLAFYRSFFGLPALPNCTTWPSTTPCFRKLNQNGVEGSYPIGDRGWAEEISLDLDMVSAICPNCTILLVEANTASFLDLATAVNTAVSLGANVVSNSYGAPEWSAETSMDSAYTHPGVAVTVSSGDSGYGVEYPAASPHVTAVGGTNLVQATNTGTRSATETAWTGAGSGCSDVEGKPSWQTDAGCATRTVADVSAVADPATGVWVYDTYGGDRGWMIFGGTSVAAPIVGSAFALAGNGSSASELASYIYAHTAALNDITSGSNGACSTTYLCTAGASFDGPTGWGTPNDIAAFKPAATAVAPTVGSVTPAHAPAGTAVTITGSNLSGATTIAFGTLNQTAFTVSPDGTQITTTAPVQPSAGTVDVTVTTPAGASAASAADRFGYDPVVSGVNPTHAPAGTSVTVTGTNLTGATAVSFGTVAGTIKTISPTQITVAAPDQAVGTSVDLTVTTPIATSALNAGDEFTYDAPLVASYSLGISPSTASAKQAPPTTFQVNLQAINGYAFPVTLSVAGLPAGSYSFSSNPVTPSAAGVTVTLRVSTKALARGTAYPFTVTGTGADGLIRQANASLTISP
jgi:subtilase family serine protease